MKSVYQYADVSIHESCVLIRRRINTWNPCINTIEAKPAPDPDIWEIISLDYEIFGD